MNRCLHVTMHDNAGALSRGATAPLPGRGSTDPGSSNVISPVDDPGSSNVIASVDDPSSGTRFPSAAPPGTAAPRSLVVPRDSSGFIIVRMVRGIEHPQAISLWQLARLHVPRLAGLRAALEIPDEAETAGQRRRSRARKPRHFASHPLVDLPGMARVDALERIRHLEKQAVASPFPPRHSLTLYWRLDLRQSSGLIEEVVERLSRLAEVDLAYREWTATDPQTPAADGVDFAEDQGYLADAPVGIGASWASQYLPAEPSSKFILCDLEQGWNLGHDDLKDSQNRPLLAAPLFGDNRVVDEPGSGHHGTAVLGQLVAAGRSAIGVKGAATSLGRLVLASHYKARESGRELGGTNGHVAEAIVQALAAPTPLAAGDVLLLEVQRRLLPTEVDEADFDAIRLASGLGVIVIEAAGNGGFDLDLSSELDIRRSLRRGAPDFLDSGAILVGAARAGLTHDRAPFSNYGSRLDCFSWGESVTTCGFGDLAGTGDTNSYTNHFSGTSSAVPIIAGAAALLQRLYEAHAGVRLGPQAMRAFLSDAATGTRQGPNVAGHIGVMPDLEAIVREQLQVVPDIYLRRSIGDNGSAAGPQDEISSSPDLLVSRGGIIETSNRFGEGTLRENLPAPGDLYTGSKDEIYVRLRNRGIGSGEVHVRLFASPAATLITSERWIPIGGLDLRAVPQGDTLVVAGPVVPAPALTCPPGTLWSFLAILSRPGETGDPQAVGLPPGPPYFDWTEYRAFLRQPGVAWRNTHRVAATRSTALTFRIAGTPDRDRHFDFEVIQRLPDGATVALTVGEALAAKLRQRQPWLDGDSGPRISLPKRPRAAIRGVQLAAGAYAEATFTVDAGGSVLTAGHSLALRQLWRGEEVGRITWFFGPHL